MEKKNSRECKKKRFTSKVISRYQMAVPFLKVFDFDWDTLIYHVFLPIYTSVD